MPPSQVYDEWRSRVSSPKVAFEGVAVTEPKLRTTPAGGSVTSFKVVCEPSKKSNQKEVPLIVNVWGPNAEKVVADVTKGDRVVVNGKLVYVRFTPNGSDALVERIEVDAAMVGRMVGQ